ncbi:hypothetical protein PTTG_28010 [Puccinia triticina 1-1 BBBD Race 1]|uniref:Tet-like 2OG-Fe(II) oxygenase domain-containing protein n=1 Tax=Puccinia triticina (isolate 1-1 / race 1 (BBBD)) TaxID=630390 RepID=A0A180GF67_PUCT1|nr:hypothetical protein PTTG_28010 [Puccinia triticina 1-1 BBBD Race 1]
MRRGYNPVRLYPLPKPKKGGSRKLYFKNNPSLNRNDVENEDRESPNDNIEGSPNDDWDKESSDDDAEGSTDDDAEGSTDDDAEGSTDDDYNKEFSYDNIEGSNNENHEESSNANSEESSDVNCEQSSNLNTKESSPAVSETNKDPFDEDQFIAYIEFTTSEDLSQEDLANVQFVAAFLQKSKKFVGKVQSVCKIFRGWMLSIGWRKSQTPGETAGIFRNLKEIIKNTCAYLDHVFNGKSASEAIHRLFHSIANTAVEEANKQLSDLNMPAFSDPDLKPKPDRIDFANNLSFT